MTNEASTYIAPRNAALNVRPRPIVPCRHHSFVVVFLVLGWLIGTPSAVAESSVEAERAARLVNTEQDDRGGRRLAQNIDGGFAVGDVSGPAAAPIPIPVRIPEIGGGGYNFLVFRNLPKAFQMSSGFPVEDQWVVPLDQVKDLSIRAPEGYRGSFELEIKLRLGGTDKSETRTVPVNIFAPGANKRLAQTRTGSTGEAQGLSEDKEQVMMQRAEALLATRDVAAARMIYQYLVQQGSGKAAYGMARTFDPAYVKEVGVAGMNAQDVDQAKKWYERAALLGHKEAQERLKVMAAGTQ